MMIDIVKPDDSAIPSIVLRFGNIETIKVSNLEAITKNFKMFLMAADDKDPRVSAVANSEGNEIVTEGWVQARAIGDTDWTTLGLPTFGDTFDDITGDLLAFSLAGLETKTFEIKITMPEGPMTAGIANFVVKVSAYGA